jgi:hypothetical protein
MTGTPVSTARRAAPVRGTKKAAIRRADVPFDKDGDRPAVADIPAGILQCRATILQRYRDFPDRSQEPAEYRHIEGLGSDEHIQALARENMDHERVGGTGMVGNINLRPGWQYPLATNGQLEHQGGIEQEYYSPQGIKRII